LRYLGDAVESFPEDGKPITVFFDEAPWLDSRRSGFIDALEYFWKATGSKHPRLKLFVCGSAASWIIRKILHGKEPRRVRLGRYRSPVLFRPSGTEGRIRRAFRFAVR
jgi:hypothetical protein